jgi:capsular polysaccharide biosynthesis protein
MLTLAPQIAISVPLAPGTVQPNREKYTPGRAQVRAEGHSSAVDIHEIARRLWSRWPVVAALAVAGAVVGLLLHVGDETRYTSTVRVLAAGDPLTSPGALADELLAVVTTTTRVQAAIEDAADDDGDAARSVAEVADHVTVEPLGQSSVLALSVSDPDPEVAAALANSLSKQAVDTLTPSGDGGDGDDGDSDASDATSVEGPIVIESARPAETPDRSRLAADAVLGLFLGLIAGVGAAAVLETLRPTLVAPRYVAEAFGTRLLGDVSPAASPEGDGGKVPPLVATTVRYAADHADVNTVWLVGVDPLVNIEALADELRAALPEPSPDLVGAKAGTSKSDADSAATTDGLRVHVWTPHRDVFPDSGAKWAGLVIVASPQLPFDQVQQLRQIIELISLPVLGLITYRQ